MRSLYKGIIGFGLVSIPIQVFKAMESERVTTHWIHEPCRTRIQYQKFCPTCERPVPAEEVATGAPLPDGRFVVLPPADKLQPGDHTITIVNFPELKEIDPVFYETAYWLKPGPGGQKAYRLLTRAMRDMGRVALAEMTLRQRPSLAVVRAYNETTLMLHRMYYPESLRQDGASFGPPVEENIPDKELAMARTLIEHMAEPFEPERYPNRARLERLKQIEELMPSAVMPQTTPEREVMDLMEKLKASVDAREKHGAG
ncbi:Ku protein [Sulfobacillus harzensis]|uniref:Ku domain-containing protein n=1 Tax=Sulfobacillus harzensis TaxID=2729629 RepID=A0A7Y0L3J4_9FIRM|nr:Ku protein [Sulfobacillus harzensis]NMP22438.1 Ku domain-containing protein [Sulfobacillus harzensis]